MRAEQQQRLCPETPPTTETDCSETVEARLLLVHVQPPAVAHPENNGILAAAAADRARPGRSPAA